MRDHAATESKWRLRLEHGVGRCERACDSASCQAECAESVATRRTSSLGGHFPSLLQTALWRIFFRLFRSRCSPTGGTPCLSFVSDGPSRPLWQSDSYCEAPLGARAGEDE